MRRVMMIAILVLVAIPSWTIDDTEVWEFWRELTEDQQLVILNRYLDIKAATPVLEQPPLVVLQQRDGTINAYFDGTLGISIADYLKYDITLPAVTVQGNREVSWFRWLGIGLAVGVPVGILAAIAVGSFVP